jgi:Protein of unknown function DUF262/Protein of unknown function (DUF1524)/Restriction Enzyme Adenine Methylase Associated
METQVRTPQLVFMQPQRFVVPLFQRPYVWNEENQWEPLWNDVTLAAGRLLKNPGERHHPHFLGAVVLQQVQKRTGQMQERTVIDGQQRLTTLQLLLDALHAQLVAIGAMQSAMRIEPLIKNAQAFCSNPEDQFKVWPTNRDRPAFNAVMGAEPPISYGTVGHQGERIVQAHRYFSEEAGAWLTAEGEQAAQVRAAAVETVVRELLQMVVIDLTADENAQEIFETLNARGAQLSAADLIKNFVFQRLLETGTNVEEAYRDSWSEFETGFWEKEVSVGRLRYPRSAIFLNHWLIARTGKEVVAREVFNRFKYFADYEAGVSMAALLRQLHAAAAAYRTFITSASTPAGPVDRLGLFGYRTSVLESEVIKPLVLCLKDTEHEPIAEAQLVKALEVIESWMVRRMLVRATTKSYNQVVAEIITEIRGVNRARAGDAIENYLSAQTSASKHWPDDRELQQELSDLQAYRRIRRGRLRMVLEAVEDHLRGWKDGRPGLGNERVTRGRLAIEHVMPRKWQLHWQLEPGRSENEREQLLHTFGNLTLLTGKLNSKVSNGPWQGAGGKREGLEAHDVLFLNREILKQPVGQWSDEAIRERTKRLIRLIAEVWPVPPGHRSEVAPEKAKLKFVELSDLIGAAVLQPGMPLFPRREKQSHRAATLLADGRIDVEGTIFNTASEAATHIAGKRTNGWWFFLTDQNSRRSLRNVRRDYLSTVEFDEPDVENDEDDDDDT